MLELRNISKQFGAFTALDGVSFHVDSGEIVGLLGENGAGKSTLISIVSGNLAPTSGEFLWQGKAAHLHSPREATALGIGIVHQHFRLVPSFTVAENIALASPHNQLMFSEYDWSKRIEQWAQTLGWKVAPAERVENLGVGERQRVEIMKALFAHQGADPARSTPRLLLLDEPTANLTPDEVDDLFEVLLRLKNRGCALVFVSHKLSEVLEICDRASVLRRGNLVGERKSNQTDAHELAELMVGHSVEESTFGRRTSSSQSNVCLEISSLCCGALRDFSLQLRRGEIVGIAGVDGNGQSELAEVLSGLRKPSAGNFEVIAQSPTEGETSLATIPADRQHVGLITNFSLYENIALHPAMRVACKRPFFFDWKAARQRTQKLMQQFDVRAPQSADSTPAAQLSGGNQQKLVIARALSFPHDVVVAVDPTRGLDFAATKFVHEQLRKAAAEGSGVFLISTDLDEVLKLSDRIGVLCGGQLLPQRGLLPSGTDRRVVGRLMGGIEYSNAVPTAHEVAPA